MGKGSSTRTCDTKRYEENFDKIDWSGPYGVSVMETEQWRQLQDNAALRDWLERCQEHFVERVDGDDGNTTD
jgi:hypothetical protein